MHTVLSIAGSDCSGGAGIQADLKTITAHRLYGMSVITALTAQNTMGVQRVLPIGADFVTAQLDSIFTDIYPDSVKIGMIPDLSVAQACLLYTSGRKWAQPAPAYPGDGPYPSDSYSFTISRISSCGGLSI